MNHAIGRHDHAARPHQKGTMDTALTSPNRTLLLGLYRRMRTIRRFEERTADLRRDGDIVGSVHLCNGQEAICVGTADALDLTVDVVFPTYRGHGWGLACGVPRLRCSPR